MKWNKSTNRAMDTMGGGWGSDRHRQMERKGVKWIQPAWGQQWWIDANHVAITTSPHYQLICYVLCSIYTKWTPHCMYTEIHQRANQQSSLCVLSFQYLSNNPQSVPAVKCPWTDISLMSKHVMQNTGHMMTLLALTEHCLTVLCISKNIKTKMYKIKLTRSLFSQNCCWWECPEKNTQAQIEQILFSQRQKKSKFYRIQISILYFYPVAA